MNPVKWFSFNYIAGWMVSDVIDSSRTYTIPHGRRDYYFNKFLAASMFTFNPWKNCDISVGNSVVSCAPYFNPAYLSPFLFYVNSSYSGDSVQKTYYGRNSQLFFNISSRQIRHLHLYASLFIDGFSWKVFTTSGRHNPVGWKAGFRVSDFLLNNVSVTAEYTRNNPLAYKSADPVLTFASSSYGLGSYLLDNSQEFYGAIGYIPIRGLSVTVSYIFAERGQDVAYDEFEDNYSVPLLKDLSWNDQTIGVSVRYEFLNNAYVFIDFMNRYTGGEKQYTPTMFFGNTNTVVAGFNIGF
jgi:hypothetical protein